MEEALNFTQDYVNYALLALCYAQLGQVQQSRQYEQKAVEMTVDNPERLGTVNYVRAVIRYRERLFSEAITFATAGMESSLAKYDLSNAQKNMNVLYHTWQTTGDMAKALFFLKQMTALNDSIMKKEKQEQVILNQIKYDSLLKDEQIREANRRNAESLFRIRIFGAGGLIFAVLSAILFYLYQQKQKAYRNLVLKNRQWAGAGTVDSADEKDTAQQATERTVPDTMEKTIMEEVEKLLENRLYKDPNLTLESLADKIGLHQNYVSAAINRCVGKNFRTYVNEYRVKEAIRIFSAHNTAGLTIDEVAYHSGFSERTNFYRTFKKMTGLSPTKFRSSPPN